MNDESIKVLAKFTAELLAALEHRPPERLSWPEWFAAMHAADNQQVTGKGIEKSRAAA